jgi:hypothetical protein
MTPPIIIGIDPGTDTGFAVKDLATGQFSIVRTLPIHRAWEQVVDLADFVGRTSIYVVVEDARQRKWIPKEAGREKLQGAGSIKRDCAIWEDFLTDQGIPHRMVAPAKGRTKWSEAFWKQATGYTGRTSNHARDAAVLVLGVNEKNLLTFNWKIKS